MNKFHLFLTAGVLALSACSKDQDATSSMLFKTENPMAQAKSFSTVLFENPSLRGDTTVTLMTSFKLGIGDVWVSQDEVKAGAADDLDWIKLTTSTNNEIKLFEDYSFPAVSLPVGQYRSIKMSLRNICYRHVVLADDPDVKYELLETMGSSTDPCDENDQSWANTNYFSTAGNHILNDENRFELVAPGEKLSGFTIEEEKTAIVTWRLGAGETSPCTNYLYDVNKNGQWDCGIDQMDIECPPTAQYMWDFVVTYDAAK
ncbi:hypothetical protein [Roseimarinus sediminis]|uniref:hypothetical protein n=1 Tax=Roseimarinus sediminis TaxID=1610899 RepID=UPI003D1A7317